MATVQDYNEKMDITKMLDGKAQEKSKTPNMENSVVVFQFGKEVPQDYIKFLNNDDYEIGPMQEKILDNGDYKVVIYFRKPKEEDGS